MANVYKRGKTYWIRFQHDGQTIRKSARTTRRDEALKFLVDQQQEHQRWTRDGRRRYSMIEVVERFLEDHLSTLRLSTQGSYRNNIRQLSPYFMHLNLDEVGKASISEFISARRRAGASGPTIRRDLAVLSSMISHTISWGWCDANPVKNYDKRSVRERPPRVRYLTPDELECLLDAASPHLRPIISLAVFTGMRTGEILPLRWSQVDLERREVTLPVTKSGLPRVVPLSASAVTIFVTTRRHPANLYIFPNPETGRPYQRIAVGFRNALRRACIADFRFHDLRHTFASWAVQGGMDLYRLSRILGHATTDMTTRYAHLATADLHRAIEEHGTPAVTGRSRFGSASETRTP